MSEDHHRAEPGPAAGFQPFLDQPRPDALPLPPGHHRHRRQPRDDRGPDLDRRETDVPDDFSVVLGDEGKEGPGRLSQRIDEVGLERLAEGGLVDAPDRGNVGRGFGTDLQHGIGIG